MIRREDFPPPYGAVGEDHGDVEWNHGREDCIEVVPRDHLLYGGPERIKFVNSRKKKMETVKQRC